MSRLANQCTTYLIVPSESSLLQFPICQKGASMDLLNSRFTVARNPTQRRLKFAKLPPLNCGNPTTVAPLNTRFGGIREWVLKGHIQCDIDDLTTDDLVHDDRLQLGF